MTIRDIIDQVDELKPNNVDRARKISWLNDIDRQVFGDIFARHERDMNNPESFTGYTQETAEDTKLLVPDLHAELYRWFLEMQIDLVNMEMGKYNNSALLFDNAWNAFAAWYNRAHIPICSTNFKY
jgi:hypothetical protein